MTADAETMFPPPETDLMSPKDKRALLKETLENLVTDSEQKARIDSLLPEIWVNANHEKAFMAPQQYQELKEILNNLDRSGKLMIELDKLTEVLEPHTAELDPTGAV